MTPPLIPARPCLLLVDDTPANIDVLVGILQADYILKIATRGAKALKICEGDERIDLILLDVMMPEMDGFTVCRTLRATPATKHIPIIFLTARTEVEDIVQAFEIGANDYVAKPFRPPELLARVRTHLLLQDQQREINAKNEELKALLQLVGHDVANQFTVLSMSLELAARYPAAGLAKFFPRMQAAVRNGIGLTDLIRELRTAEDKALELTPVPLKAAVAEALLLADDRMRAKELTVDCDVPDIAVLAERFSLTNSVLGNLLTNAAKFSHRGATIHLTATVHDDRVTLSVRDRGVGIAPDRLEHLFDVNRSRSLPGTEGERGTGFGMPLLHRLVHKYGGTVQVTSRELASHPADHGTEFTIDLLPAPAAATG
jgi:CheY-like chemotaxis protein